MGILDRSSSTTTNLTSQLSQNIDASAGGPGAGAQAGGDLTIINTDQNAFDNASDLARRSVEAAERFVSGSQNLTLDVASRTLTANRDVTESALGFSEGVVDQALAASRDYASELTSAVGDAYDRANSAIVDTFDSALRFVTGATQRQQDSLTSTVTSLNTIAREQSKSTDERVAEVSQNAIKYGVIAVAVIAAAVVAWRFTK